MTETKEREAYRMRCKHYGVEGNCYKQSHAERIYGYHLPWILLALPTADARE